ncbi:hypothetical protein DVH05_003512 [Phytophthora capsici]|nr:hypothetical protein DVH05_003512 [Phytophthora capsici]
MNREVEPMNRGAAEDEIARAVENEVGPEPKRCAVQAPPTVVVVRKHRLKLDIDDFTGCGEPQIEWWLKAAEQAAERQRVLDGETWAPLEMYYGVSKHLKDDAEKWFCSICTRIPTEDRTFENLATLLKRRFGKHESKLQTQMRITRRVQQPGERLDDYAANRSSIGIVHDNIPDYWYVESFLRGINNEASAMFVRGTKPKTLEDAVRFAVDVCGDYGEGYNMNDWKIAARRYRRPPESDQRASDGQDDRQPAEGALLHLDARGQQVLKEIAAEVRSCAAVTAAQTTAAMTAAQTTATPTTKSLKRKRRRNRISERCNSEIWRRVKRRPSVLTVEDLDTGTWNVHYETLMLVSAKTVLKTEDA